MVAQLSGSFKIEAAPGKLGCPVCDGRGRGREGQVPWKSRPAPRAWGVGFASIRETQPGALLLGFPFLVRRCGLGVYGEVPDGVGPTDWLSELGWPLAGEIAFSGPELERGAFALISGWSDAPLSYRLAQFCPDKPPRMMLEKQQSQRCSSILPSQGESKMMMVMMMVT